MFGSLANRILNQVRSRFAGNENPVVRTFVLCASDSLSDVRSQYENRWVPRPDCTAPFYQWIFSSREKGAISSDDLKTAVQMSFDAEAVHSLSLEDMSLRENITQVIVVGDLGDTSLQPTLSDCLSFLLDELRASLHSNPVLVTGIFRLGDGIDAQTRKNTLASLHGSGVFHRILLLDSANSHWRLDREESDVVVLIAQLVHFLINFSESGPAEDYLNWLKSDDLSGSAAFTLSYPVAKLLQFTSVKKGSDALKQAMERNYDSNVVDEFFNRFVAENQFVTKAEIVNGLRDAIGSELVEPLKYLPDFPDGPVEDFLCTVDEIDAAYPQFIETNTNLIKDRSWLQLANWQEELDRFIDTSIASQGAGFRASAEFIEKLIGHMSEMAGPQRETAVVSEPKEILDDILRWNEKSPKNLALWSRGLVVGVSAAVLLSTFPLSGVASVGAIIGGTLFAVMPVLFKIWLRKREIENFAVELSKRMHGKWNILMQERWDEIISAMLEEYETYAQSLLTQIRNTEGRFTELIEYFSSEYMPEIPGGSASWMPLAKGRGDFTLFSEDIAVDQKKFEQGFYEQDQPLLFWRRFEGGVIGNPTEWESHVFEDAATQALGFCENLFDLTINDYLVEHPDKVRIYRDLLLRGANPYVRLKPGTLSGSTVYTDFDSGGEHPITIELTQSFKDNFDRVDDIRSSNPCQLNCYSVEEGFSLDELIIPGGR